MLTHHFSFLGILFSSNRISVKKCVGMPCLLLSLVLLFTFFYILPSLLFSAIFSCILYLLLLFKIFCGIQRHELLARA